MKDFFLLFADVNYVVCLYALQGLTEASIFELVLDRANELSEMLSYAFFAEFSEALPISEDAVERTLISEELLEVLVLNTKHKCRRKTGL